MKALRVVVVLVAGLVVGALVWWFRHSDEREAGYRDVSRTLCVRFATDAIGRVAEVAVAGSPGGVKNPVTAFAIFSPQVDARIVDAGIVRDKATMAAPSSRERGVEESKHVETVLKILETEVPDYLKLCEQLTAVYLKCDAFSREKEKFRSCVEREQKTAVADIATYLFRNAPK